MARLRINSLGGYLDAALTTVGTTLTSDALAAAPAISNPDYLPIVLSPDGYLGGPYLAHITAHTAGATTATITAVDTRAVTLPAGVEWVHAIQEDDFFTPSATRLTLTSDETILNNVGTPIPWDSAAPAALVVGDELWNVSDPTKIAPPEGVYVFSVSVRSTTSTWTGDLSVSLTMYDASNAVVAGLGQLRRPQNTGTYRVGVTATASAFVPAGHYVQCVVQQDSGSSKDLDSGGTFATVVRVA